MAPFIPQEKITEIKNRADIVDVVSESVLLKKAGRNYLGLCPFHSEKTPSFTVSPEKQIFYCFGCGEGGNIFSFLMKMDGLSFPEATRRLAQRYGIELPTQLHPDQRRQMGERERLLAINRSALDFFHHHLLKSETGIQARKYLEQRNISGESIQRFRLGYAPEGWESLTRFFQKKRIPLNLVEKVGLIVARKHQDGFYDRFRDRLIFPIFDLSSRVIGFGGRVLDEGLPKYLNSPESPLYSKGKSLYALEEARRPCRETDTVFIVEGYIDAIRLHSAGIENTVATLGTALTDDHVRTLKGYARKVVLVFDSDAAGLRAAQRSAGLFVREELDARVMVLPPGYDPDAFVLEHGAEKFMAFVERASAMISFLIDSAVETHGLSIEGKLRVLTEMQQPLASIPDGVARSLYIKELSERIGVDESAIIEKIRNTVPADRQTRHPVPVRGQGAGAGPSTRIASGKNRLERQIVAMMLQYTEVVPEVDRRNLLERFVDDTLRSIAQAVLSCPEKPVDEIIDTIEDKTERSIAAGLAMGDDVWDREGCLKLIAQFERSRNRQGNDLLRKIKVAEAEKDHRLLLELLKKRQQQVNQS